MANIIIATVDLCDGTGHVKITGTVKGVAVTRSYLRSELTEDPEDQDELEEKVLTRLISAVKEANATTLQQIRNALIGPTFKV
jgi:hypothetical protein